MNSIDVQDNETRCDYIISCCPLAAHGVLSIMNASTMKPVILSCDAINIPVDVRFCRFYIYLPNDLNSIFITIKFISEVIKKVNEPLHFFILGQCSANFLWCTLRRLVRSTILLSDIYLLDSAVSVEKISFYLNTNELGKLNLRDQASFQQMIYGKKCNGIGELEINVILGCINGVDITTQARNIGKSRKTLYNQYNSGIKKINIENSKINLQFRGIKKNMKENLSGFESEFVNAIFSQEIYAVFQIITDGQKKIQGFEILSRWNKKNKLLLPAEFLPKLKSEYPWLALTAFTLQEAVNKINQYAGDFYFSINIPPILADNVNLYELIKKACSGLSYSENISRLRLEFSENSCFSNSTVVAENIIQLRKNGYKVFVDDCFSESSVIIPTKLMPLDGFKFDMAFTNNYQHDKYSHALMKSVLYYCQLTKSITIAEGITNHEQFTELRNLGVSSFQGYYLSPPEKECFLSEIIKAYS